ncbi:S-layer homology domain-containing protein [Cohnella luojiensis]|nr:S-layer homology domain-containing protein [Cohnella luojiensis]
MKKLSGLLIICFLIFGWAGNVVAAQEVKTNVTEDGRVQVIMEFDDIKEAEWAAGYIGKMKSKQVVEGFEDGTYRPNQPITRVQAIVMAVRLMGLENEAKAKTPNTKLHFKDAELIDKEFKWAKGYIVVALENGLFDATEDRIQPNKPASRIWVAGLLVKSLGLQAEALSQMATIPEFTDAEQIPAGVVGYLLVAVDKGIVSGYPDGSFKPHKNVTRAEMAALLDRTNEGLLENSGAVKVSGKIKDIDFDATRVTTNVDQLISVTDSVYRPMDGQITIDSYTGEALSYGISSELLVQYHNKFIRADQLAVGDPVGLVVQDQTVIEAALLDAKGIDDTTAAILGFEVEMELGDDKEYKLKYKNMNGRVEAEIVEKNKKWKGKEAEAFLEKLLSEMSLTPDLSRDEVLETVLAALNVKEFKDIELKIQFSNGEKLTIEKENEDFVSDNADGGVREFELKAEWSGEEKLKLKYKNHEGDVEAEVEIESKNDKEKMKGDEAAEMIENVLEQTALSDEMTKQEITESILTALEIDADELKELEIKIKFTNGTELEIEFEQDDDEDEEDEDDEDNEDDE